MVHGEVGSPSETRLNFPKEQLEQRALPEKSNAQKRCEFRGGVWDEATKTCSVPETEPGFGEVEPKEEIQPTPPSPPGTVVTDAETGEVKGFINSQGNFVKASKADVQLRISRDQEERAFQEATTTTEQFAEQQRDIAGKLKLASQVGQIDFVLASQLDDMGINWKEAFLAGTGKIDIVSIGAAAGAGAFAGGAAAIPTAGLGPAAVAAIAAGGTAISQFYKGVQENIKAQKGDLLSGKRTELKQRQRAMMNYISAANANPAAADEMVLAYNIEKSLVRSDYLSLSHEASEALTLFGGQDGTPQLIAYEIFFESVEPSLDLRMEEAVLKPDPTRAYLSVEDFE